MEGGPGAGVVVCGVGEILAIIAKIKRSAKPENSLQVKGRKTAVQE